MRTDLFDFELPDGSIALHPTEPRDAARLLVVDPDGGLGDRCVRDLPSLLRPGDALVCNDTRVLAAALIGVRMRGEAPARVSFNLTRRLDASRYEALARPQRRLAVGDRVIVSDRGEVCAADTLEARVEALGVDGLVTLAFTFAGAHLDDAIARHGQPPLPPYIARKRALEPADRQRYQTMFAAHDGAVAAPTAGLHFTPALMDALAARGISHHTLTLHVGTGTFLPVKAEDTGQHTMHGEWGALSAATAEALNGTRDRGGRIVAVGSTSLRLLESAADATGRLHAFDGETAIFITPGYRFRAVDVLMTNFHLPRSTLFMLVAAFAGLTTMRDAYAHALQSGYRFYSYGDASLLFRSELPA